MDSLPFTNSIEFQYNFIAKIDSFNEHLSLFAIVICDNFFEYNDETNESFEMEKILKQVGLLKKQPQRSTDRIKLTEP